jgi:xylulokinase
MAGGAGVAGPLWLGIDVGTSSVKAVLVDDGDAVVAEASAPLTVDRPHPMWAEQHPDAWWAATAESLDRLAADRPDGMARVGAVGLSGQMLGVAALDGDGRPIRPAILWNDGRAAAEGAALEAAVPGFAAVTGSRPMPGFPAPKLLWLARHEPDVLARARHVLLPKDYIRWRLSGEVAADRADASATLLMDTAGGDWHPGILAACGVGAAQLPRLVESAEVTGTVLPDLARRWRLPAGVPVVGGGGDNMCGGVGAGTVTDGAAFVSLGTSGVYFVANRDFRSSIGQGMHTHRHAVPGLFCQQAVILSAAAALTWVADLVGAADIGRPVGEVGRRPVARRRRSSPPTPASARHTTIRPARLLLRAVAATGGCIVQAVMKGGARRADCQTRWRRRGRRLGPVAMVGSGAHRLWTDTVAAATGRR